jgi:hypothetical protein
MLGILKIRPCRGVIESGDDPEKYLGEVEVVAEAWPAIKTTPKAQAIEKTLLRFFCENLNPDSEASWCGRAFPSRIAEIGLRSRRPF